MKTLFVFAGFLFFVFPAAAQITDIGNNVGIKDYTPNYKLQVQSSYQSIVVKSNSNNTYDASNIKVLMLQLTPANEEINGTNSKYPLNNI